ncbi:MAG TPA: N-acetylmuramic acid 6-phosphate etherase [Terriglobales bacterium]|nr:N-acetylmuramic acid 6-phosphate etherase [Terriglobales bacterium]
MTTENIHRLGTEQQNVSSLDLDTRSALEIARIMNAEDAKVPAAVSEALPQIAKAIDAVADALSRKGRLIYVGAGTSGRLGALDSSECPPTFNTDPRSVQYVIAGGPKALASAAEANEDSPVLGRRDIAKLKPGKRDVVIGIAASGRTPYTIAACEYARKKGARTACVVCNISSPLAAAVDIPIEVNVGPEVLAGSTRLKAGTAQKLVLNMITTGAMTRLGYVYGNLMVNVHLKNEKLVERGIGIVQKATGASREDAMAALKESSNRVPVALVMLKAEVSRREAEKRLKKSNGNVRKAMNAK